MTISNTKIWNSGELIAIKYLQKKDYKILETNFRFSNFWEIDIIAQKEDTTVFIEVKYRSNEKYWSPEESMTKYKLSKCRKTMQYYCKKNYISFENIRFDAIAILKQTKSYKITHYKNIEI